MRPVRLPERLQAAEVGPPPRQLGPSGPPPWGRPHSCHRVCLFLVSGQPIRPMPRSSIGRLWSIHWSSQNPTCGRGSECIFLFWSDGFQGCSGCYFLWTPLAEFCFVAGTRAGYGTTFSTSGEGCLRLTGMMRAEALFLKKSHVTAEWRIKVSSCYLPWSIAYYHLKHCFQ